MSIHHRRSLENYTRFQTKMGKAYTRFHSGQNDSKSIPFGAARTDIIAYVKEVYNRLKKKGLKACL